MRLECAGQLAGISEGRTRGRSAGTGHGGETRLGGDAPRAGRASQRPNRSGLPRRGLVYVYMSPNVHVTDASKLHGPQDIPGSKLTTVTLDQLETPALVVDLDVLERNLARLATYVSDHRVQLRPHTKTHKIPEIARMQIASGCSGITVAKSGEAEVMAKAGLGQHSDCLPGIRRSQSGEDCELGARARRSRSR